MNKREINRERLEMNNWLESIERPELQMSLKEAIELVMS